MSAGAEAAGKTDPARPFDGDAEYFAHVLLDATALLHASLASPSLDVGSSAKGLGKAQLSLDGLMLDESEADLRWFLLPAEAVLVLSSSSQLNYRPSPFCAKTFGNVTADVPAAAVSASPAEAEAGASGGGSGSVEEDLFNGMLGNFDVDLQEDVSEAPPRQRHLWHAPSKALTRPTEQAVKEFSMIRNGDKVLIGLSGGKDSLSLVHLMKHMQRRCLKHGTRFEFGCVTVDPQTEAFDPSPLKGYMAALGVPYFYEEQHIIQAAKQAKGDVSSICSFCSKLKRGRLYACLKREGYNVLALGQHCDDLAESFLMAAFRNGCLRTMKAHYTESSGAVRIIRPLIFCRESALAQFAASADLPVITENCPACFSVPTERARIKRLLAAQEHAVPTLFNSLRTAMIPLMSDGYVAEEAGLEESCRL